MKKSNSVKRKVPIRKPSTKARKHLEPHEVDAMLKAARGSEAGTGSVTRRPSFCATGTGCELRSW
jgi:hypothetical protein